MQHERTEIEFQGMKQWLKRGEYIISTLSDDGTLWTYTASALPIFDFRRTKIFQALESGPAEIKLLERNDTLFFSIKGVKVSPVYDFDSPEDNTIPSRRDA